MMVGLDANSILQALSILEVQFEDTNYEMRMVADYSMPNVSNKIVRIIQSYTDYINRVVWKKY